MVWETHVSAAKSSDIPAGEQSLRTKPLKRRGGLSKYYSAKSQSFSSIELALSDLRAQGFGDSAAALGKAAGGSYSGTLSDISPQASCESCAERSGTCYASSSWSADEDAMCEEFIMAMEFSCGGRPRPTPPLDIARTLAHPLARLSRCSLRSAVSSLSSRSSTQCSRTDLASFEAFKKSSSTLAQVVPEHDALEE